MGCQDNAGNPRFALSTVYGEWSMDLRRNERIKFMRIRIVGLYHLLLAALLNLCTLQFRVRACRVVVAIFFTGGFLPSVLSQPAANPPAWLPQDPPPGFFVPANLFSNSGARVPVKRGDSLPVNALAAGELLKTGVPAVTPNAWQSVVHLYVSPATQTYFATGGLDYKSNHRVWESVLRRYKIPFKLMYSVDQLEELASGVLLLPSSVVMSAREKQAVLSFRTKGGSVLATWLSGVRGESGDWQGFDFMEQALDAKVVGATSADNDAGYLIPKGDSPVSFSLPAGQRIWIERAKEWYPLRLTGANAAAFVLDWSRTTEPGKSAENILFDERRLANGVSSRSVVMGYPERLWASGDRKRLDVLAHDALTWLLRRPSAHVAAWPYPFSSAYVMAVDATDMIGDADLALAKLYEDIGGKATYYSVGELAAASAYLLKTLQDRGHEMGYLGDTFSVFRGQPLAMQGKRLDTMRKDFKDSGLSFPPDAGFHPPIDAYDKATETLLVEQKFGHYIGFLGATDARTPYFANAGSSTSQSAKRTVVLPKTQVGPDELLEGGNLKQAVAAFLGDVDMTSKMSGLSVGRVVNPSPLNQKQWAEIMQFLKDRRDRMWLATSGQVADWWRERDRVQVSLVSDATQTYLTVTVQEGDPLRQNVAVLINLPESGIPVRVQPDDDTRHTLKIEKIDAWRAAAVLAGLPSGKHTWRLHFERSEPR